MIKCDEKCIFSFIFQITDTYNRYYYKTQSTSASVVYLYRRFPHDFTINVQGFSCMYSIIKVKVVQVKKRMGTINMLFNGGTTNHDYSKLYEKGIR